MARVLPEHRRRGVGSELVRALAEHGRALGRNGVNSFVEWHDDASIRFAEKLGLDGGRLPARAGASGR